MSQKNFTLVRGGERAEAKKLGTTEKGKAAIPSKKKVVLPIPTRKVKVVEPTKKRLYVLDTNVFIHDPTCLFRFQEHDIFITSTVFEELDNNKSGNEEKNRNVRQVSRTIELITSPKSVNLQEGAPLIAFSQGIATGRLFLQTEEINGIAEIVKPDNQILAMVAHLAQKHKNICEVVLVTNDTNMRIKARAKGMPVEDYHNDSVSDIDDTDLLHPGFTKLPLDFWDTHNPESWQVGKDTYYKISDPLMKNLLINEFIQLSGEKEFNARVTGKKGNAVTFKVIDDYSNEKHAVLGVVARNIQQNFALNLLLDPSVDMVSLAGTTGSGKTLVTLAAALKQIQEDKSYDEIIITRATVSVGDDIGFLPGTAEDKMGPWMGALYDNIDVLAGITPAHKKFKTGSLTDYQESKTTEQNEAKKKLLSHIKIESMNFMRGRTFLNKFVIIDEAQNLTPKQMKTLITRAGPGTKMVCLGNLAQIDTPYLTEGSSGLTYTVNKFKGWEHGGHVVLLKGERSRLATYAEEVL